jgi:hypothetical protein
MEVAKTFWKIHFGNNVLDQTNIPTLVAGEY